MARDRKLFEEQDIERLKSEVYAVDPSLYVFTNRGGESVFYLYDPLSGAPTVTAAIFIMRKGYGHCALLDGGTFPRSGVHVLENGWGVASVNISAYATTAQAITFAKETAVKLMWELRSGIFELAQAGAIGRLQIHAKYIAHRVRMKVAALMAA